VTERKEDVQPEPGGFTRRSLIAGSAGVATTVAVTAVAPAAATALRREAPATPVPTPTTPIPPDPVLAYVHDAARSQVTVINGEVERTYHDPALTKRLLDAANSSTEGAR
jgi:hypothetical protein